MTTTDSFYPNSRRIYAPGKINPDVQVALREVSQSPTRLPDGRTEENASVRIYDTSGPWGDPDFRGDVAEGLPALRRRGFWVGQMWRSMKGAGRFRSTTDTSAKSMSRARCATVAADNWTFSRV